MALQGLHHLTAITADAQANVDFYAGLLGLRLVKKTVNFDEPSVYHLYFGDDSGTPGSILTFFEFPGAAPGGAGDGMIHTIQWRVAGDEALAFWEQRLGEAGCTVERSGALLRFRDPEGLALELVGGDNGATDALAAHSTDIPDGFALQGFAGVRAFSARPQASAPLLCALGFSGGDGDAWRLGEALLQYDAPPGRGRPGAGTVHHVAWSAADDAELGQLRGVVAGTGAHPTPIIDRQYFHSVYFREPSGVLFELASRDIGFDVDEPLESLGQALKLPAQYEARREQISAILTPLDDPRTPA